MNWVEKKTHGLGTDIKNDENVGNKLKGKEGSGETGGYDGRKKYELTKKRIKVRRDLSDTYETWLQEI